MQPLLAAAMTIAFLGCGGSPSVEQVETDVPVLTADCRVECDGQSDTCDASWTSCGKCGDPCDVNGERGVCDTCCESEVDMLRCRPLE
jgi:hypothetical protein